MQHPVLLPEGWSQRFVKAGNTVLYHQCFYLRGASSTYGHELPQSLIKTMLPDVAIKLSYLCFPGGMSESVNDTNAEKTSQIFF